MSTFLIQLGSMSLQASVAILVVLVLRKVFVSVGVSKKYIILLWIIPFFLFVCPWKIGMPMGFWQVAPSDYNEAYTEYAMERFAENMLANERTQMQELVSGENEKVENVALEQTEVTEVFRFSEAGKQFAKNLLIVAEVIWLAGVAAFFIYAAFSYALLRKKVSCNLKQAEGIYRVDELPAPIVLGFFKPQIYLPSGLEEAHISYVVAHEKTHIRRCDPLIKLLAYLVVCIHWFNPLAWVAFYFLEKDMEMACDEETIQRIGTEQKQNYATALLQLSVGTRRVFVVPLAFGEGDTKGRIKNVMHYKKTVKAAAILAVATGVLVFAVFMTKQEQNELGNTEVLKEQEVLENAELEALKQQQELEEQKEQLEQEQAESERELRLTFTRFWYEVENHTLHELDFHSYENGEEYHFDNPDVLNYYINFYFDYEGEIYKVEASHWTENDELESVYITRESDGEMCWLYRESDGEKKYSDYLGTFLATKENVEEWLSIELPEGYSLGKYLANRGLAGGALIFPQAYEIYGEELSAPEEWYYAGFVGRITYAGDYFTFENGKLKDAELDFWNHTSSEEISIWDLDWQVVFCSYNHDLYTAAGQGTLEENGIDIEQIDTTSDYWYFFFAKEGEDTAYYISLSQKLFAKEEAIAIAETVDIKK